MIKCNFIQIKIGEIFEFQLKRYEKVGTNLFNAENNQRKVYQTNVPGSSTPCKELLIPEFMECYVDNQESLIY